VHWRGGCGGNRSRDLLRLLPYSYGLYARVSTIFGKCGVYYAAETAATVK
jgi:hypothetical protein